MRWCKFRACPAVRSEPFVTVLLNRDRSFSSFFGNFHKKVAIASRVCRMALIRSALESPDPGASNSGSNFKIRHSGVDIATFEVAGWTRISKIGLPVSDENRKFAATFGKKLSYGRVFVARH